MSEQLRDINDIDDEAKTGPITHNDARAMLSRFINSHFKNPGEHARASIPVDFTRDDDLVGFVPSGNSHRFAFGEVKTSQQAVSPPSVMTGRHGLSRQIEDLRDRPPVKDGLVRYLAFRATSSTWEPRFKAAATTYLNDPTDVHLFGILVRDTSPHQDDLRTRTVALAKKRPPSTTIELRAIYLPSASISTLATRAASLKTGGGS